jgi:hypothetical protein
MLKKIMLDPTPASAEVVAERLAVCRACENLKSVTVPIVKKDIETCGLCSCPLMTRTYFKHNQCAATKPKW